MQHLLHVDQNENKLIKDMEVAVIQENNKASVKISGRLDTTTTPQFQEAIKPLIDGETTKIEIDCSGMDYTSSLGLRSFLLLQKSMSSKGGSMVLTGMQAKVREVFDITGFSSIIKIV